MHAPRHLGRRPLLTLLCGAALSARAQRDPFEWLNQVQEAGENLLGRPRDPVAARTGLLKRLEDTFDGYLYNPAEYRRMIREACGAWPEAAMVPYAMPAMAYAHRAFSGALRREAAVVRLGRLLDLAIPAAAAWTKAPAGNLVNLPDAARQAGILSPLLVMLALHRRLAGPGAYERVHAHVSGLLIRGLESAKGAELASHAAYTRYADTLVALLGLWIGEGKAEGRSAALLAAHQDWRARVLRIPATGLPRGFKSQGSRGSDVALQICMLSHMAPDASRDLYRRFVGTHWKETPVLAGYTEHPRGMAAPAQEPTDNGPVFQELGAVATLLGLGAAAAANDAERHERLVGLLAALPTLLRTVLSAAAAADQPGHDARLLTTHLCGDALAFYALSWSPLQR